MTVETRNEMQETARLDVPPKPPADAPVEHNFRTMELLGESGAKTDGNMVMAFAIGLVLCVVLYGLLYLAMQTQG